MQLHYTIHGTGEPLVLIHGYLSDGNYWHSIVPQLTEHYQVITIDLLGFGKSPKPNTSDYSLATHAQAVADTLRPLINQPAIIMGHSMGCLVSSQLAITNPKLVSKLILCNMPFFETPEQARGVVMKTGRVYRAMLYSPLARLFWPIAKLLLRGKFAPGPKGAFSVHHTYPSRTRSLKNTIEPTSAVKLLKRTTHPTVVINGTYDRRVYRQNLEAAHLPTNIQLRWVETGHHTISRAPRAVLDELVP